MFQVDSFIRELKENGKKIPCDESEDSFCKGGVLPPFYDELKFKRGQKFFRKHIFGMFFAKLLGLISILAIPSIRNVLMFTKMSGDGFTAYKRYLGTVFHMCVWYRSDFRPGSNLWKSTTEVKSKHNAASKRHSSSGSRITQFDMAVTQFGFMGYVMTSPKSVGIHSFTEEELEGFVHLWRVIGWVIGIKDEFNICRETVDETKEICDGLLKEIIKPQVEKLDCDFVSLSGALVDGMWCFNPFLEINAILMYIFMLIGSSGNFSNNNENKLDTSALRRLHFWLMRMVMSYIRFGLFRGLHNVIQVLSLFLMVNLPFLAYYKFGKKNSHVVILNDKNAIFRDS